MWWSVCKPYRAKYTTVDAGGKVSLVPPGAGFGRISQTSRPLEPGKSFQFSRPSYLREMPLDAAVSSRLVFSLVHFSFILSVKFTYFPFNWFPPWRLIRLGSTRNFVRIFSTWDPSPWTPDRSTSQEII